MKKEFRTFFLLVLFVIPFLMKAQTISIAKLNPTVGEAIEMVEKSTPYKFVFNTSDLDLSKTVTVPLKDQNIKEFMHSLLSTQKEGLSYTVKDFVVIIQKQGSQVSRSPEQKKIVAVRGVVFDSYKEPVIGAHVKVSGKSGGCATDMDGQFMLSQLTIGDKLEISYIGHETQFITVSENNYSNIKVFLKDDTKLLDEVVVTGYGTFKKSAYAGSASNVSSEKIRDIPSISFKDLLQGNAPGVQFSSSSGQPGASSSINIRGMGSFNASNSPLYVIDGVPVHSGNINAMSSSAGLDIMSTISSSDIQNVTIIKDAAAASLYGSRAANGVILITTKRGSLGKPQISFKADWGSSDFAMPYRPVMGGEERREYIYNALIARAIKEGGSKDDAIVYANNKIDDYAPIPWCGYVDWDKILFNKGIYQTYEGSVAGGTDQFKYYSSISYIKQNGVTINSGLERISGRLNADYQATEKLGLGVNMLFSVVNQDVYSEGTSYTAPLYSSRNSVVPSDAPYNDDGTWNREFIRNGDRNPLLAATYDYQKEYVTRAFNTTYAQYELIKDLKLKSTFSYDYIVTKGDDWDDPRTSNGEKKNGGMSKKFYERKKMVWANQLNYKFNLSDNHHFDVLGGYEIDDQYRDYLSGYATNYATPDKNDISNGMKTESVGGNHIRSRMISYLSRLNYDYKKKYYFGGSFRTDGSSRLHKNSRWGSFWSLSAAWRTIEEEFMNPVKGWMTDLKFRTSYGVNGTLPSNYFGYMGLSSLTNGYIEAPGMIQTQIKNLDLKWETNYNLNLGVDFALFNRVNATLEYYIRTTRNLLMDRPISMTSGFNSYLMNIGEVLNKGVELEINSLNINTKNFSWKTIFNISHNKNKIVKLDGIQTEIKRGNQIHKVGKPYRTFYMVEFAGINPDTGAPQFYTNDIDEQGNYIKEITEKYNEANAIVLDRHAEPDVIGGLSNSLIYKWFDLGLLFSYQFGGYSYDTWAQKTEHGGNDLAANIPIYYRNSWKNPGDITDFELFIEDPSVAMNKSTTTRRLHKSDFIRLKTFTFGYSVPKEKINRIGIDYLRLFVSANNLWTWAAYDYYDPEAVNGGVSIWGTPPLKAVTLGLSLKF